MNQSCKTAHRLLMIEYENFSKIVTSRLLHHGGMMVDALELTLHTSSPKGYSQAGIIWRETSDFPDDAFDEACESLFL